MIEIVALKKFGGPLTKQISLNPDGTLHSDKSACSMGSGTARRMQLDSLAALAQLIGNMASNEAIALGAQFGQEAIFVLTPAERQVVGCAQRRIVATGWSIEPEADVPGATGASRA